MKKIIGFLLIIALTSATACMAQSIGIKGGLNISNISASDENMNFDDFYDPIFGPVYGLDILFPLTGDFQLKTGITFSSKGAEGESSTTIMGDIFTAKSSIKLYYLDLPVNVQYTFLRDKVDLYVFGGPMIGIGISGTQSLETTLNGVTQDDFKEDIRWGNNENNDDFRRIELAARLGAGVAVRSFMLEVYYDLGINNISAFTDFDTRVSNRVLGIALIYKL